MKRSREERRLYHDLAWTWPIVSPPGRYVREAQAICRLIRGRAPAASTLLHLGCGGGHLDKTLKQSFEITGVDLSPAMLALARRPNPADTTYESTFIYLIRNRGRLRVETDHHRLGLFPLPVWRRLLRTTGFRITQVVGEPDQPGSRGNATFVCVRPAIKR